jgi:hypothetical protein
VEPFDSPAALALQHKVWRGQRLAWALMVLVVLAALLGLSGSGPLSGRSAVSADGTVRIEYERFLRRGTPTTLKIHWAPTGRDAAGFSVWLARPYLEDVTIQDMLPPPQAVQASPDRVTWRFGVNSQDHGAPVTVTIHFAPGAIGRLRGTVGLEARPGLGFSQWVYP